MEVWYPFHDWGRLCWDERWFKISYFVRGAVNFVLPDNESSNMKVRVFENNQGAKVLIGCMLSSSNRKHIGARRHFLRQLVPNGDISEECVLKNKSTRIFLWRHLSKRTLKCPVVSWQAWIKKNSSDLFIYFLDWLTSKCVCDLQSWFLGCYINDLSWVLLSTKFLVEKYRMFFCPGAGLFVGEVLIQVYFR